MTAELKPALPGMTVAPLLATDVARMGGNARAQKLSPERRSAIAKAAAVKRWRTPPSWDNDRLLAIAALIDAEVHAWKEGFCICYGHGKRRRYEWGEGRDTVWVRPRVEKLEDGAAYLRKLASGSA